MKTLFRWSLVAAFGLLLAHVMWTIMDADYKAQAEHDAKYHCVKTGETQESFFMMPVVINNSTTLQYVPQTDYKYQCDYGAEWR